jgi:hypothetical protein
MAQDNKRGARRGGGATHPMMIGVFMGVLLGLCAALALALYLFKASPFVAKDKDSAASKPLARAETPKGPPAGLPTQPPPVATVPSSSAASAAPSTGTKQADAKQRFDFYMRAGTWADQDRALASTAPVISCRRGVPEADADNLKAPCALRSRGADPNRNHRTAACGTGPPRPYFQPRRMLARTLRQNRSNPASITSRGPRR